MKNIVKITAMLLILSMAAVMLVSCSTFGSIKSNFEKNGYEYVEIKDDASEDEAKQANTIVASLEKGEISCTAHLFKTKTNVNASVIEIVVPSYAMVLEFKSDKELDEALADNETIKGIIKDAQKSDVVNGNCLLIPLSVAKYDEMVKIFKGKE
ncbi:MAG: hypothetical protein SOZ62_01985 [Eubacteriales bacterium]|nr:hypothetical protein [Eubacteriales bacterium]